MTITHPVDDTPTIVPLSLIWENGEDISDMEAVDAVIISDRLESIDVGGAGPLHRVYLRVTAPDLVRSTTALKEFCDRIIEVVMDARQDKADAEAHDCHCSIRLEADEVDCGAPACRRRTEAEWRDRT